MYRGVDIMALTFANLFFAISWGLFLGKASPDVLCVSQIGKGCASGKPNTVDFSALTRKKSMINPSSTECKALLAEIMGIGTPNFIQHPPHVIALESAKLCFSQVISGAPQSLSCIYVKVLRLIETKIKGIVGELFKPSETLASIWFIIA